jgi:hypothetical protein
MAKQNFYRVGQVGKELGLSSYKIRRLAESGLIPDAEFSGVQWHIPVAAVERMKREGVPALPKIIDTDNEGESPTANPKERAPTTLLAEPSSEMIAAAEEAEISSRELTVAKNNLERKRVRREESEIDDYFENKAKRLQEEEEQQYRRYEDQWEAELRKRDKEAAIERRQKFINTWLEYALQQIPSGVPSEIELDVHQQVLDPLAKVDGNERDYVVRRLVDAAVERGLRSWKTEQAKGAALKAAISQLPYGMQWDDSWKRRAAKAAAESLADVRPGSSRDELDALARAALEPLTVEYEHGKKVKEAINSVQIAGADYDEITEARDLAQEALAALPAGSTDRQITLARDRAAKTVANRVAERLAAEENQRQRQRVMDSVQWKLPRGMSDADEQDAIAKVQKALDELPAGSSEKDMETARDEIISGDQADYDAKAKTAARKAERARKKEQLIAAGLRAIYGHAQRLKKQYDFQQEMALQIEARVKPKVKKILEEEVIGNEDEQEVVRTVYRIMKDIEGCR